VYIGPEGVLTGSMRKAQETREEVEKQAKLQEAERKKRELVRKRRALEARIMALQAELEAEGEEITTLEETDRINEIMENDIRATMARSRKSDKIEAAKTNKAGVKK
jgi:circadian clock protein KaiC